VSSLSNPRCAYFAICDCTIVRFTSCIKIAADAARLTTPHWISTKFGILAILSRMRKTAKFGHDPLSSFANPGWSLPMHLLHLKQANKSFIKSPDLSLTQNHLLYLRQIRYISYATQYRNMCKVWSQSLPQFLQP